MATVQFTVPDGDLKCFAEQALHEGITLDVWLRVAAQERLARERQAHEHPRPPGPFETVEDLEAFFLWCDTLEGPEREPDWEEHLRVINESRARGTSGT